MSNILAVDPGSVNIGWSLYDTAKDRFLDHGTFTLGTSKDEVWRRLQGVRDVALDLLPKDEAYKVGLLAIERQFSSRSNADRILAYVAITFIIRAWRQGVSVVEIAPKSWKKVVTGSGNATKKQVRALLEKAYGETFQSDDQSDACGIALAAAAGIGARTI